MLWKDVVWWRWQQALGTTLNLSGWRHTAQGRNFSWEAELEYIFGTEWKVKAAQASWSDLSGQYVHAVYAHYKFRCLEDRFRKPAPSAPDPSEPPLKKVRFLPPNTWLPPEGPQPRLLLQGDSFLVV